MFYGGNTEQKYVDIFLYSESKIYCQGLAHLPPNDLNLKISGISENNHKKVSLTWNVT